MTLIQIYLPVEVRKNACLSHILKDDARFSHWVNKGIFPDTKFITFDLEQCSVYSVNTLPTHLMDYGGMGEYETIQSVEQLENLLNYISENQPSFVTAVPIPPRKKKYTPVIEHIVTLPLAEHQKEVFQFFQNSIEQYMKKVINKSYYKHVKLIP